VVEPGGLERAVRAAAGSLRTGAQLTGGADVVYDCIGSPDSLAQALRVVRPGGTVLVVGMPGHTSLDLTGLWHREVALKGSYAYTRPDFDAAISLVAQAKLGQLVSALYPLDRFRDAIEHAANAGRRGAVKIAFDLRQERL
jgi:threonine dehydrogenase-like Zn-dependent dehydrogenase